MSGSGLANRTLVEQRFAICCGVSISALVKLVDWISAAGTLGQPTKKAIKLLFDCLLFVSFLFGWFSAVTRASEETYLFYVAPVFCKGLFINSNAGGAHARKYKNRESPSNS